MERKNPDNNALDELAEARFAKEVAVTIANDPFSIGKPLKYSEGSQVYIEGQKDIFRVKKGKAGVYLLQSRDGKPMLCIEAGMSKVN